MPSDSWLLTPDYFFISEAMARAVEQIERDIAALEEAVSAIGAELRSAYANYLTALGQAVRQQLILASYHLCTQGYSEAFLSLSFSQRQQLQQSIRKLGQQASDQLLVYTRTEQEIENRDWGLGTREEEETRGLAQDVEAVEGTGSSPTAAHPPSSPSSSPNPSKPEELVQWQQNLEQAIANTLKTVSRKANRLLQQTGILPKKLPEPLLEAAANSLEASAEATAGPPNLLNLLIETESDQESEDSTVTNIIAINLRLSEIEFADATVRAGRNQIRNLLAKASKMGREYHKKQRERQVAEAEAAWRASWFED